MTLKKQSEFNLIYKKGKRVYGKYITLIFLPSDEIRFAFVVSKKVGNAVIRNKAKRRLRAIARNIQFINGWYLFMARPSIKEVNFQNLEQDIQKCLLRLKQ